MQASSSQSPYPNTTFESWRSPDSLTDPAEAGRVKAKASELLFLTSQDATRGGDKERVLDTIERENSTYGYGFEAREAPHIVYYQDEKEKLDFAIYYPDATKRRDKCIVYHNPNGVPLWQTAVRVQGISELGGGCPVLMYDYRGAGCNRRMVETTQIGWSNQMTTTSYPFRADATTVIQDGEAVLKWALENFEKVCVVGTSLGGAVATISTRNVILADYGDLRTRKIMGLFSQNSFSTTSEHRSKSWLTTTVTKLGTWGCNFELDAKSAMEDLIVFTNMKIGILSSREDSVITGTTMREAIESYLVEINRVDDLSHRVFLLNGEGGHFSVDERMRDMVITQVFADQVIDPAAPGPSSSAQLPPPSDDES